jgi:hypothetical protein
MHKDPRYALYAKNFQDVLYFADEKSFNAKKMILENHENHQVVYSKLDVEYSSEFIKRKNLDIQMITFKIVRNQCDLINMVDLVLPNPKNLNLNTIMCRIDVDFGGCCIDKFSVREDIDTQIKTQAALFNRKISYIDGKTIVPLAMGPLHNENLVMPSTQHHTLKILVCFKADYIETVNPEEIELHANKYYVSNPKTLIETYQCFPIMQTQYCGAEYVKNRVNKYKLSYNHPVYMLYFWGFDKTKVKRVRLLLDDAVFFDGSMATLEHKKACMGYSHIEPAMLFFSEDPLGSCTKSIVNFSKIDNPVLEIESEQECESEIYIVAINMQPFRYIEGMVGLAFSG